MKILFLTDYFPPEIGSASHLFYELSISLIARGQEVLVLTGFPRYNINSSELPERYKNNFILNEEIDAIRVCRIRTFALPRKINLLRGLDQFLSAFLYFLRALTIKNYDCLIVYSPPLSLGLIAYFLKLIKGKKTIINIQDLFPKSAIDLGALRNKPLIKFFNKLERLVYLKNDYIIVHSEGNKKYVESVAGNKARAVAIPNGVNTSKIKPGPKNNDFSLKYNLSAKFVVSFAGVLGESQDLEIICDVAMDLASYKDMVFVIVGDGRKKKIVEERKTREFIDNLILIPLQLMSGYPLVLHSSDIGLVTLKKDVRSPVVPSKIFTIMAAGIPIVAALPCESDGYSVIKESGGGFCVSAGDEQGFKEAILKIYKDSLLKKELGENGRRFVERNYSLETCVDKYQEILSYS